MFLGVVETKIQDLCPLPPIYPFKMAPFGSRFGPIRPRIKKKGVRDPKMVIFGGFWYFGQKSIFWGVWQNPGLGSATPYLNPSKAFLW